MSHRVENIKNHHAGNSRLIKLQVRYPADSEDEEFGDPVDIRSADVRYYFSEQSSGPDCIFKKTTSDDIEIVDGVNGFVEIKWKPEDTEGLGNGEESDSKEYFHECEFTDSDGDVSTVFTGTVEVINGLTC